MLFYQFLIMLIRHFCSSIFLSVFLTFLSFTRFPSHLLPLLADIPVISIYTRHRREDDVEKWFCNRVNENENFQITFNENENFQITFNENENFQITFNENENFQITFNENENFQITFNENENFQITLTL